MTIRSIIAPALAIGLCFSLPLATQARADAPEIKSVDVRKVGMGWRFDVTLEHPDTGWDHFADGWEVVDANGQSLGFRELMHPHVNEQPFTRSLSNVMVPDGARKVWIRVRCNQHDWAEALYEVSLDPGY